MTDWSRTALTNAIHTAGVRPGDTVFTHANIGLLGTCEGDPIDAAVGAFVDAVGPSGTWVVPTFTYSFGTGQSGVFNIAHSPSTCGPLTEAVRTRPDAHRTRDPMFSVAAIGPDSGALAAGYPETCFGTDSVWAELFKRNAWIVNVNLDAGSTFLHHIERLYQVPYRQHRPFRGTFVDGEARWVHAIWYFSRDLSKPEHEADFRTFSEWAIARELATIVEVGRGSIIALRARDAAALLADGLAHDRGFLIKGTP